MLYIIGLTALLIPTVVFAQAFGEYGRAVGSIPHGQGITGGKTPGGVSPGNVSGGGVGEVGGRGLPVRLVVVSQNTGLPRRISGSDGSGGRRQRMVYGQDSKRSSRLGHGRRRS